MKSELSENDRQSALRMSKMISDITADFNAYHFSIVWQITDEEQSRAKQEIHSTNWVRDEGYECNVLGSSNLARENTSTRQPSNRNQPRRINKVIAHAQSKLYHKLHNTYTKIPFLPIQRKRPNMLAIQKQVHCHFQECAWYLCGCLWSWVG